MRTSVPMVELGDRIGCRRLHYAVEASTVGVGKVEPMLGRVVAAGLGWPEGPTVLPDGSIAFVEMYRSQVSVLRPGREVERLAHTGGGPNATVLGDDGCLYVTQNGGVDGPWQADQPMPASIQRIDPDGRVEVLFTDVAGRRLLAPNDLAFGPDGRLYFTDPGRYEPEHPPASGGIFAVDASGAGELIVETGPVYPNGIIVEPDGSVVWTESYTRRVTRRTPDGSCHQLVTWPEPENVPDGLKADMEGRLYVTTTGSGGVHVLEQDGRAAGFLATGGVPTNCVFQGSRLWVTDGGHSGTAVATQTGSLRVLDLDVTGAACPAGHLAPPIGQSGETGRWTGGEKR